MVTTDYILILILVFFISMMRYFYLLDMSRHKLMGKKYRIVERTNGLGETWYLAQFQSPIGLWHHVHKDYRYHQIEAQARESIEEAKRRKVQRLKERQIKSRVIS